MGGQSTWSPPLCTILLSPQVCLEGEISRQSILNSLSRGKKASGDLIPWTVSEQVKCFPWCVSGVSWRCWRLSFVVKLLACASLTVPRPRLRQSLRWKGGSHCCSPGLSRGNVSSCLQTWRAVVSCRHVAGHSLGQVYLVV